jgi:hypothetical protein
MSSIFASRFTGSLIFVRPTSKGILNISALSLQALIVFTTNGVAFGAG